MKKIVQTAAAALLCALLGALLAGCGYQVEGQVPRGEEGSMLFFGVNYNRENSLAEGVTIEINFAHEKPLEKDAPYVVYSYVETGDDSYKAESLYSLPLQFATGEEYNTKSVKKDEFIPGMFAYTCKFPQKAVELTLPAALLAGEAGSFTLVLAESGADLNDLSELCTYDFDYTVNGDTVTLES